MPLPATPDRLDRARRFLLARWQERLQEIGRAVVPEDLSGACLFCALFVEAVFGARCQSNWYHSWNVLPDGTRLDLCAGNQDVRDWLCEGISLYTPDPAFTHSLDFADALDTVRPRAAHWAATFLEQEQDP